MNNILYSFKTALFGITTALTLASCSQPLSESELAAWKIKADQNKTLNDAKRRAQPDAVVTSCIGEICTSALLVNVKTNSAKCPYIGDATTTRIDYLIVQGSPEDTPKNPEEMRNHKMVKSEYTCR